MVERRLGRGLEFFLSGSAAGGGGDEVSQVELVKLTPSPFQPRKEFSQEELAELAQSLRATGVLQPILVRKVGDQFEIVAGERRWRAAQVAGLERIPALVKALSDDQAAIYGLVENIQRKDLNPIEKAKAFKRIQSLTKGNQEEIARQVGLDRSTIANLMRLLELPAEIQAHVSRGTITMGHARALLALSSSDEQRALVEQILKERLSVRQVEEIVQGLAGAEGGSAATQKGKRPARGQPAWAREIEEALEESLRVKVRVRPGKKRIRILLECMGREEFERLYEKLKYVGDEQS
jgi:ParB family chromosome partitioning protein